MFDNSGFGLAGKVAVITGSTRGIGLATARMLAASGARVVISSRKPEACDSTVAALAADGHQAIAIPAHIGRAEDCHRLIDSAAERWGRIDILIANAAINPVFEPLSELSEEVWAKMLDTNVSAPWRLASRAMPVMRAQETGGAIVMVSSITGRVATERSGAYGTTKAALEQMTRQLALEGGPDGIRVNGVAPGTTRTDMIRALTENPDYVARVEQKTPLRRLGDPEDVAAAIAFLASSAARQITGQILTVDGGETICRF